MNKGIVKFYDELKEFGFIKDYKTEKEYYVNASGLSEPIHEHDEVSFELQEGKKGMNAINVKVL